MFSTSYRLTTEYTAGDNWTITNASAILCGNILRCFFSGTRSETTTGNIANETVVSLTIYHEGKINGAMRNVFTQGSYGGIATFVSSDGTCTEETLTFDVVLSAAAHDATSYNSYFVIPVKINLDAF